METTQGISLHSYPYLKLAKHWVFHIIIYVFSSTKLENRSSEQILPQGRAGEGVGINNVYTCKFVQKQ
jgi:hypothetical protein